MSWLVSNKKIDNYLTICREASQNDYVFENFKSLPEYREILEHCPVQIALNYLQNITRQNDWLLNIKALFANDQYGEPDIHDFGGIKCSPSTLQYIGVLSNLIDLFGPLHHYDIIEIGGGYGGQCKIISDIFLVHDYHIIDLPEVVLLQQRYLKEFRVKVKTFTTQNYPIKKYDLAISNYALTEISDPLQTQYVNDILLNSEHGYLTCNGPIFAIDILKGKKKVKRAPDINGERASNYILSW